MQQLLEIHQNSHHSADGSLWVDSIRTDSSGALILAKTKFKIGIRLPLNIFGLLSNFYQYLVVRYICFYVVSRMSTPSVAVILHRYQI